ncbi:pyruvate kinase [Acetitomaculum ruminis DSM 5522]|uniref:Pyruvate kinase n=1 Tax=Acetitomaculum ruminis DSM 5522 TaxID=1120918 RepID=A0A1I0YMN5_9FIRM|nr:pyruvate kinase [Acetitomaculum ruminis]SFB13383.1 pyruvate kinase [Acetitomaculum ruminis DSM 5522]
MRSIRKTKVICTLGPASASEEVMTQLVESGMDVARFNFSHGTHEYMKEVYDRLDSIRKKCGKPVAALLDTKGPEIRIGTFAEGKIQLDEGQNFTLTTREVEGTKDIVTVSYKDLPKDVEVGGTILLDDGLIELKITSIDDDDIQCVVVNGGPVSDRKGVNVPNVELNMPYISQKDHDDIVFGIETGFDFIAASFTRTAADIYDIRSILKEHGRKDIAIIAKIENQQGVDNIDEIIQAADGIMVARGDMGVEIPLEDVPALQKVMIKKTYTQGKIVITATQMLDSMMKNPRPTRAEATDVANAIYDGTSAIMLSGETASGSYPVQALKTMVRIAKRTEQDINYEQRFRQRKPETLSDITGAISHASCMTAHDLGVAAIITVTKSGFTARMISKYRPSCPIIGCTTSEEAWRKLNICWGVTPLLIKVEDERNTDHMFDQSVDLCEELGLIDVGELVVITAGIPLGVSGTTNLVKVHVAGHVLIKGIGVSELKGRGRLCVCSNIKDVPDKFQKGDVLVVPVTNNSIIKQIKEASAIITEDKSSTSHAATVGLTLDIPVIIGATNATKILKTGSVVEVDAQKGIVINE